MTVDRFPSMGCTVVVAGATRFELDAVRRLFEARDATFSRFRRGSELNRVNSGNGRVVSISPLFARMLQRALEAAAQTDGLVDPTLGRALEATGYDRDFSQLAPVASPAVAGPRGTPGSVRLGDGLLWVPAGVQLDLNGVVKAGTVDDALSLIRGEGFVCAGGDLATRGAVDVALPGGDAVRLTAGALATSGSVRRRWLRAGVLQHHLINPRTGRPAESAWEQVTVSGATCLDADIAAKASFLLSDEGPEWLDRLGIPGRFVAADQTVKTNEAWRTSLADALCT
jgi:thiamine biosynthesis lipoprotein